MLRVFLGLLVFDLCIGVTFGQSYGVSVVAGTTTTRDGVQATENFLRAPIGVAVDSAGVFYVADAVDNRIRRIARNGIITTLAGTGSSGFSGDGGQAISAEFDGPTKLAIDKRQNLLYVVDDGNNRVRQINLTTGVIRTVAGSGSPRFSGVGPDATRVGMDAEGVAVDTTGNLYITDFDGSRIYRVVISTGALELVAGVGSFGNTGDGGPALGALLDGPASVAIFEDNLYFVDYFNTRVRKIDLKTGVISAFAGDGFPTSDGENGPATAASVFLPDAIAVDSTGNVLISELYQVRVVNREGIISTLAGSRVRGFAGDGGPARSARIGIAEGLATLEGSDFLIADTENNRIRRVSGVNISTIAGTDIRDGGPATNAILNTPRGVHKDSQGNIWITDSRNFRVRKVDSSGRISTAGGTGYGGFSEGRIGRGHGVVSDSRGNLYWVDQSNNRIMQIPSGSTTPRVFAGPVNAATSGFAGDGGNALAARFSTPLGIAIDSRDNVYIADWGNDRVRRISADGTISTIAGAGSTAASGDGGPATSAGVSPADVAVDKDGNIFIADDLNNRIRRVAASDGIITTIAGTGAFGSAGDGGQARSATLSLPEAVAVDAAGNVFFSHLGRIRRINSAGVVTLIGGTGELVATRETGSATEVQMDPLDLQVNADGTILVADAINSRIRLLTPLRPASLTISSGNNVSAPAGSTVTLSAKVADTAGLAIANEPVAFSVTAGQGTLGAASVLTGRDGLAIVSLRLPDTPGAVTVRATSGNLTPVTFNVTATAASTGPAISSGGVAGAPLSAPAVRALSANGIASVFGSNFAPAGTSRSVSSSDLVNGQIPTTFAGVCVRVGDVRAPVFAVFPNQINFQAPSPLAGGEVEVRVITGCGTSSEQVSAPERVTVRAATPEFFYFSQRADGVNPVAAANASTNQPVGGNFAPVRPGDVLTIYATGFGETDPALAAGEIPSAIARVRAPVSVTLNGRAVAAANVLYAGIAPFNPGLYQVNLIVPEDAPDGDLPIVIRIGDQSSPTGPYLRVANSGVSAAEALKSARKRNITRGRGQEKPEAR